MRKKDLIKAIWTVINFAYEIYKIYSSHRASDPLYDYIAYIEIWKTCERAYKYYELEKAFKIIKQYKNIENIIEEIIKEKE